MFSSLRQQVVWMMQHYWKHLPKSKTDTAVLKNCSNRWFLYFFLMSLRTAFIRPLGNAGDTLLWTLRQTYMQLHPCWRCVESIHHKNTSNKRNISLTMTQQQCNCHILILASKADNDNNNNNNNTNNNNKRYILVIDTWGLLTRCFIQWQTLTKSMSLGRSLEENHLWLLKHNYKLHLMGTELIMQFSNLIPMASGLLGCKHLTVLTVLSGPKAVSFFLPDRYYSFTIFLLQHCWLDRNGYISVGFPPTVQQIRHNETLWSILARQLWARLLLQEPTCSNMSPPIKTKNQFKYLLDIPRADILEICT